MCEQHLAQGRSASYIKGCIAVIGLSHWGAAGAEPGADSSAGKIAAVSSPGARAASAAEPWCSPHRSNPFPAVESTLLQHAGHFPCQAVLWMGRGRVKGWRSPRRNKDGPAPSGLKPRVLRSGQASASWAAWDARHHTQIHSDQTDSHTPTHTS